ncbi:MAG TPA: signal peptidase II [Candidatus Binataceae bacterium]|nr:signal peptidase II [Candidatus Binataceae bacterium]
MLATVTLPVVLLDQLTKSLIRENFSLDHTVALVPGWLDLTYTLNPGAAFSLFATMPPLFRHLFFIILSFAAIVVLLSLLARRATPLAAAVAYALILGGTIGNLIDRLVFGRVIDFIYFHHAWFNYPVFNLADSAITTGVVVAIVFGLFGASDPR